MSLKIFLTLLIITYVYNSKIKVSNTFRQANLNNSNATANFPLPENNSTNSSNAVPSFIPGFIQPSNQTTKGVSTYSVAGGASMIIETDAYAIQFTLSSQDKNFVNALKNMDTAYTNLVSSMNQLNSTTAPELYLVDRKILTANGVFNLTNVYQNVFLTPDSLALALSNIQNNINYQIYYGLSQDKFNMIRSILNSASYNDAIQNAMGSSGDVGIFIQRNSQPYAATFDNVILNGFDAVFDNENQIYYFIPKNLERNDKFIASVKATVVFLE